MLFASPLWLTLLVPLAAVVVYLLWGRRRQEVVPFLDLWTGPVKGPRPRRRFAAPPLALALAILAVLLAVLGAARPALWDPARLPALTIVVDRGATMSAGDAWVESARALQQALGAFRPSTPVDVTVVPGGAAERTDVGRWVSHVEALAPTAVDTTAALHAAVGRRLAESKGPVLVVTDRELNVASDRMVRVAPQRNVNNVGIRMLAARETPTPQVMVRLGGSASSRLELRVSSGAETFARRVELSAGEEQDVFIDAGRLGDVVKAELAVSDDFAADDVAWLVREGSPPRLEPRGALPAELARMVEVYSASRPPTPESARVAISPDPAALPATSAGVLLAEGRDPFAGADAVVRAHPVTRETQWSFGGPVRVAAAPGAGWTPVVTWGGRAAVAVRESPARQVWVGVSSDEWPRTSDYVVFWANVFDWLGGAETGFAAHPVGRLEGNWEPLERAGDGAPNGSATRPALPAEPGLWPGLYRHPESGLLRAVNAGGVRFPPPAGDDWRPRLQALLAAGGAGGARPVSSAVLLGAGACAALAAAAWKRSPRRNLAAT